LDPDGDKIGNDFKLYTSYHLGYHIEIGKKKRVFVEAQIYLGVNFRVVVKKVKIRRIILHKHKANQPSMHCANWMICLNERIAGEHQLKVSSSQFDSN